MERRLRPIGFEGVLSDENERESIIGFEHFEDGENQIMVPAYPLDDTMPSPNQTLQNNFTHSDYSPFMSERCPSSSQSSNRDSNTYTAAGKSLSCPQLMAIYHEITNEWYKEEWLTFVNGRKESYLTLDSDADEFLTIQTAIEEYYFKSGRTLLTLLPECLLLRVKSKTKTIFLPNSVISLNNLCENKTAQILFQYKLMAIICHSNETNSKLMFYKDFQTNSWYIYYNETTEIPSYSNILSYKEQEQLELITQRTNYIDSSYITPALSVLKNHPIVYVYIPDRNNTRN